MGLRENFIRNGGTRKPYWRASENTEAKYEIFPSCPLTLSLNGSACSCQTTKLKLCLLCMEITCGLDSLLKSAYRKNET